MGFLDWGRNFFNGLPLVGGITSSIWGDPDQENVQDAFKKAQQDLARQRAYQMDSRTNMLSQGAAAFGPRNQMLGQMMGERGPDAQAMDLDRILKNPMSYQQQDDIRTAAFGDGRPKPAPTQPTPTFMGRHNMGGGQNMAPSRKIRG